LTTTIEDKETKQDGATQAHVCGERGVSGYGWESGLLTNIVEVMNGMLMDAQELGSMYDYLAKIILLGPSGSGK
jgi:hypothetical protein